MAVYAQSTDHNVSRNCKAITPGHSVVCSGRQLESDSNFSPTVTIICSSSQLILMLLTHEPLSIDSQLRNVTLQYNDGNNWFKITEKWFTLSATKSTIHFYGGEYASWIYRLLSDQLVRGVGVFEFLIESGGVTKGIFELDDSDAELMTPLTASCG